NTNGAQELFLSELIRLMEKYPWCDGIDIDLERGDDYSTHAESTAMFQNVYNTIKAYDSSKLMNICLPGMTSVNGSVGGENWCVYGDLDPYCDTASIMSYGMAWSGSAPGPVSPRSWLEGIYDYAVTVMNPDKIFFGMPAYGWNWQIYDTPENLGKAYRGTSHTYYAAKYWMTGSYNFTDDAPPQPFIPIVAYWDDENKVPWALPHVYDYMEGRDATRYSYPLLSASYNGRQYLTAYGKQQKSAFGTVYVDHDAMPDSYSGVVSVSNSVTTLGDEGAATYHFTLAQAGTYDVAVKLGFPFWDKNNIHISLDGNEVDFSENRLWWPYWRTTFWAVLKKGVSLSQGTHTITISLGTKGVQFYGFRVCSSFSEEPTVGEAEYTLAPRHFKDVNGDMVGPATGFKLTLEMLRRKADSALVWYEDFRDNPPLPQSYWTTLSGEWSVWQDTSSS
ncbi:glycosyl hydrolase family 18 protein, partial [Escherichia coli]